MVSKYPRYLIEWTDPTITAPGEWTEIDTIELKLATIVSFGFLIKSNDSALLIGLSIDTEQDVDRVICAMIIPRSLVTKMQEIP